MLHLDPQRAPVAPREAATLIVLRPASPGFEIFCVRRHAQSAFMGGAVVFPGGAVDPADRDPRFETQSDGLHPRSSRFADDDAHALALAVCACREALEEARILPSTVEADRLAALQTALIGGKTFLDALAESGRMLHTRALVPFARWITPEAEQRRFDARFFMTVLPKGQLGRHDDRETVSSLWATPARMLDAFHAGDLFLAPPTLRAFELLDSAPDVEAALALCEEQTLAPICPRFIPADPPMLVLPGDPEHEHQDQRVAGSTRFVLRDGKFCSV